MERRIVPKRGIKKSKAHDEDVYRKYGNHKLMVLVSVSFQITLRIVRTLSRF